MTSSQKIGHVKNREKINTWKTEYNEFRPHLSLGNLTPDEYRKKHDQSSNIGEFLWFG